MKSFHFVEPVFRMGVSFFWDCTHEEFLDSHETEEKKINSDLINENTLGLTVTEDGFIPAIWLVDKEDKAVVVHEILHATHSVLKYKGIKLCDETEEVYAYYQEFLFNCYLEGVLQQPLNIKTKFGIDDARYELSFTREKCDEAIELANQGLQPKKQKKKGRVEKKSSSSL